MSAVITSGERHLRAVAVGFALAAGVAGLFQGLTQAGISIALERGMTAEPTEPQLLTPAGWLLLGVAGVIAWVAPRAGRAAAGLALVAVGVLVASALWSVLGALRFLSFGTPPSVWGFVATAPAVALTLVAGWAWVRDGDGPVRVVPLLLGAVIGTAATRLPGIAEYVATLLRAPDWISLPLASGGAVILATALVALAALLAAFALGGRPVPVAAVAGLVAVAGGLLVIVALRNVVTFQDMLVYGGRRLQASVAVTVTTALFEALATVALGLGLLVAGRRSRQAGPDITEASVGPYPPHP